MKICYRILHKNWYDDEAFARLCRSIAQWKEDIDELALFVGRSHHGYYPLSECREWVSVLRARMETLRGMGIASVGVNVQSTMGHLDESWDWLKRPPFQTVVGHDGHTSVSCGCPRSEGFLQYARELYATLAQAGPDFIWIDDDVRMHHHHVEYPCFCHDCVEKFNRRAGTSFSRERLVRALDEPGSAALRRAFLAFNRDAIRTVCRELAEAVRAVDPAIRVGLMPTGLAWGSYALSDLDGMLSAMDAEMVRPGGGFYHDEQPLSLWDKALSVSLQNAHSAGVPDCQYELEDFPVCWNKSAHMHLIEMTTAFMAGCNGIALNSVIPNETEALMRALHNAYPMWRRLSEVLPGTVLRGYCPLYAPEVDAAALSRHSVFSHEAQNLHNNECAFSRLGLAVTPLEKDAEVCAISGDMMAAVPNREIPVLFARGVVLDAEALAILTERGYGELAGCRLGQPYHDGLCERYLPHPINAEAAGVVRDVYMTFWDRDGITVYALEPMAGAEPLSELRSITDVPCGIGSTVYENRLGGRVAVLSYFPWRFTDTPGKLETMPRLVDYLAGGRFPAVVSGGRRVLNMLRTKETGKGLAMLLLNACFDATEALSLRLDAACDRLTVYDTRGAILPDAARFSRDADGFLRVALPPLGGWESLLLIGE